MTCATSCPFAENWYCTTCSLGVVALERLSSSSRSSRVRDARAVRAIRIQSNRGSGEVADLAAMCGKYRVRDGWPEAAPSRHYCTEILQGAVTLRRTTPAAHPLPSTVHHLPSAVMPPVIVARESGVLRLTLNRPEVLNSFTREL